MKFYKAFGFGLIFIVLAGCQWEKESNASSITEIEEETTGGSNKASYYRNLSRQKHFRYASLGPCTYPDSIPRKEIGFNSFSRLDSNETELEISLYEDCCQEFGFDYQINGERLIIFYEAISEEVCECKCLYRYKLILAEDLNPGIEVQVKRPL